MSDTLFESQNPPGAAQLHALLVGVGQYPHLPGGALPRAPKTFTLRQLSSPPLSAAAMADWLLAEHNNPPVPLGSIELLLSPAGYNPSTNAAAKLGLAAGASVDVPLASFEKISSAAKRWYDRLNTNQGNIAVFYFCGHGLQASDRYLLAADFGGDPNDWTQGMINLEETHINMETCVAQTQIYLLDACRDKPSELVERAARFTVGKPVIGSAAGAARLRNAPLFHAAVPGDSAVGPVNAQSYFTQALIDCLNGMGARPPVGNTAAVDLASLGQGLLERVDRLASDAKPTPLQLRCTMDSHFNLPITATTLHRAKLPVKVMTTVSCNPSDADAAATITVSDGSGTPQVRLAHGVTPWRLTVQSGPCNVKATFDPSIPFSDETLDVNVTPPVFPIPLDVKARQAPVAGGLKQ